MLARVTKRATYDDVLSAPEHLVAEVIDGELTLHPRPASPHALAASALATELGPPFMRGRGGPGGWVLLFEPELHLGEDIVVPNFAGWRRERMPEVPVAPFFVLAPDFACEVLSPSTVAMDRTRKLPIYARERVAHVWFVDPISRVLEVFSLDGGKYRLQAAFEGEARVRAEPFDAMDLDLGVLWAR